MKNILDLFKIFVNTIGKVKFTFILLFGLLISFLMDNKGYFHELSNPSHPIIN